MLLESLCAGAQTRPPSQSGAVHAGWRLRIDLRGTAAAGAAPRRLALCAFGGTWLHCTLNAQKFEGEGAEVEELIGVFRTWIGARPPVLEAASAG